MTRSIRFWHYHNEPVLIKIKEGQALRHYSGGKTDEGWSSETNIWEFDGHTLVSRWETDGCDCDGRMQRHGEASCPVAKIRAGTQIDGLSFPAWEAGESGQRDYSAEAMNY